jgi:hypothetical protein
MPSQRKFYKLVLKVTILSETPFTGNESLQTHAEGMDQGDDAGTFEAIQNEIISPEQAVKELHEVGSEPGFFQLTEDGEDA